ncbi:hypothetical protein E2C01_024618 [Portunus trituberculatus]|uniref:Uncharacterized protein n=1 Tax=Portunus trituberculatus TaxID=210409 RepID=A0A5B7EB28_PORTR|nr:hypothetical protein [Portunus trituberculatus]
MEGGQQGKTSGITPCCSIKPNPFDIFSTSGREKISILKDSKPQHQLWQLSSFFTDHPKAGSCAGRLGAISCLAPPSMEGLQTLPRTFALSCQRLLPSREG